jgi:holliday junction DNA helicase RuvA
MIGKLKGKFIELIDGDAIVDVNGVGYSVKVPVSFYEFLNKDVELNIETVVKEDSITLFGFKKVQEKDIFKLLKSVSGVGAKTALAIISFYGVEKINSIILNKDISLLSKVPGIGKKTAERIIVELKDKVAKTSSASVSSNQGFTHSNYEELISALTNLGYKRNDAIKILKPKEKDIIDGKPIETILKETLRGTV